MVREFIRLWVGEPCKGWFRLPWEVYSMLWSVTVLLRFFSVQTMVRKDFEEEIEFRIALLFGFVAQSSVIIRLRAFGKKGVDPFGCG